MAKVAVQPSEPERDLKPAEEQSAVEEQSAATSDLIGLRLTLYLGVAILAILAAFFLVGPVAGIAVLVAALALAVVGIVTAVRRAEETD